jgi:hypothetical protein
MGGHDCKLRLPLHLFVLVQQRLRALEEVSRYLIGIFALSVWGGINNIRVNGNDNITAIFFSSKRNSHLAVGKALAEDRKSRA